MRLDELQSGKRSTGRTTRLVEEALRLAREHRAVYIIATHARELQLEINERMPRSGIKCEDHIPRTFCWATMRVDGSHPNCVWLVDPWIIESNATFRAMFEAMTRFDLETVNTPT